MKNIIVTGANGFIGRNFIKYLNQKNFEVYAVDISHTNSTLKNLTNIHLIECKLDQLACLKNLIPCKDVTAFYHFAWMGTTGTERSDYSKQSQNAIFTCDAALLSKELNCRKFITTGTITEKVAENILENSYTSENLIYGLAKLYTHNLLDIICKKNEINYIWAKLSNIYGGDNVNGNLISYTLNEFHKGRIPSYGLCMQPYNFTYINDVIEALYLLGINDTSYYEYFISNGECMILKTYLETLACMYSSKISIGARKDDGVKYNEEWFDNSRLRDIEFKPKYNFIKGINEIRGKRDK